METQPFSPVWLYCLWLTSSWKGKVMQLGCWPSRLQTEPEGRLTLVSHFLYSSLGERTGKEQFGILSTVSAILFFLTPLHLTLALAVLVFTTCTLLPSNLWRSSCLNLLGFQACTTMQIHRNGGWKDGSVIKNTVQSWGLELGSHHPHGVAMDTYNANYKGSDTLSGLLALSWSGGG